MGDGDGFPGVVAYQDSFSTPSADLVQGRVHPHVRAASDNDPGIEEGCVVLNVSCVVAKLSYFIKIHNLTPWYITPYPYSNQHTLALARALSSTLPLTFTTRGI